MEREKLSRRLSEQSLTAGPEGQMSLELKNFLCQERTPHTSGRQGLCKNIQKKKKETMPISYMLLWHPPSTTEHAALLSTKPPLKSFDFRASSTEEKVQTE